MLYDCFRVSVVICAFFGLIHMVAMGSYVYIYFPITMILWGIYSVFHEEDKEYIRRNGDSYPLTYQDEYGYYSTVPRTRNRSHSTTSYRGFSKDYEKIANKCKRNFNIMVVKDG